MQNIIALPEFSDEKNATSVQSKTVFYGVKSLYYQNMKKPDKAGECQEKQIQLYESNPGLYLSKSNYKTALGNYLRFCIKFKRYESVESGLKKYREYDKKGYQQILRFKVQSLKLFI